MQMEHILGAGGHFLLLTNLAKHLPNSKFIVIHHAWTHPYNRFHGHKYIHPGGLINLWGGMNMFGIVGCVWVTATKTESRLPVCSMTSRVFHDFPCVP
jgi:hypothetical protein